MKGAKMRLNGTQVVSNVEELKIQKKKLERRRLNYLKLSRECHENCERAKIKQDVVLIDNEIARKEIAIKKMSMINGIKSNLCIDCGDKVPSKRIKILKENNEPITCIVCSVYFSESRVHKDHQIRVRKLIEEKYGIGIEGNLSFI